MSFISIIVPAFHLNTNNINEINKYCCSQFNINIDNFNLIEIKNNDLIDKIHYGIIFNESNLSLNKIEQLIYQRNCIQNLSDKVFESLQIITKKLNDLENLINSIKEQRKNLENKLYIKIYKEEEKNNDFIKEKRKIEYSEKVINEIKLEFKNTVEEIKSLNIKSNDKNYIQKNNINIGELNIDNNGHIKDNNAQKLCFTNCI